MNNEENKKIVENEKDIAEKEEVFDDSQQTDENDNFSNEESSKETNIVEENTSKLEAMEANSEEEKVESSEETASSTNEKLSWRQKRKKKKEEQAKAEEEEFKDDRPVLEYDKASLSKRVFSEFVDLFILLFCTFLLYVCTNLVFPYIPAYEDIVETRDTLELESGLYIENSDGDIVLITDDIEEDDATYEEKKNELSEVIDTFYQLDLFFSFDEDDTHLEDYDERKMEYEDEDAGYIFQYDEDGNVVERSVDPEYFYNFYVEEIEDYSLAYLVNNDDYLEATRAVFITDIVTLFIWYIVFVVVFYYILPVTCFKRGRQTLGMKLFSIGYIDGNALNMTLKKYTLRFLFSFVFMFILNIFAFLIPLIISMSMMFISKSSQDLTDYVFNNYCVDTKKRDIYLDYMEFLDKTMVERKISIESNDYVVKN